MKCLYAVYFKLKLFSLDQIISFECLKLVVGTETILKEEGAGEREGRLEKINS